MPYPHRTMVRGAMAVPVIYKAAGADGKFIPAVGIAYFEDGPRYRMRFGSQQQQLAVSLLYNRKQGNRSVLNRHFNGKPPPYLAMIYIQGPHFGLSFCNGDMARTVVSH